MTETGWPLIPREVLPAPVPAVKRPAHPRPAQSADAGRQLPFFGAETTEPSPADLAGLLAGPGRLGRMGGTARVSVVVEGAWRVHVLAAELVLRGLTVNWRPAAEQEQPEQEQPEDQEPVEEQEQLEEQEPPEEEEQEPSEEQEQPGEQGQPEDEREQPEVQEPSEGREPPEEGELSEKLKPDESLESSASEREKPIPRFEVLTAYSRGLNGLAQAWPRAAAQLFLSGPRLRLWVAAAGEPLPGGYALGLDPAKSTAEIDAALVRAGLAGRVSDDGRHYSIMGKRRVARLAELVGERPEAAPAELWPGGAAA